MAGELTSGDEVVVEFVFRLPPGYNEAIVNELVSKGIAIAAGLHPYWKSSTSMIRPEQVASPKLVR